jgi:hypothetical protein
MKDVCNFNGVSYQTEQIYAHRQGEGRYLVKLRCSTRRKKMQVGNMADVAPGEAKISLPRRPGQADSGIPGIGSDFNGKAGVKREEGLAPLPNVYVLIDRTSNFNLSSNCRSACLRD